MAYAEANLRKGNRLESMKTYQKLARLKPEQTDVRISLAHIYAHLNQSHDAFNELVAVFEQDPKNIEAHLLFKSLVRKFNIPSDLTNLLEEHLHFLASPGRVNIFQRMHLMEKRKYEKLIDEYSRQLDEDEGNPIVLFNRRKAEERLHIVEETLQDLEEMISDEVADEEETGITAGIIEPVEEPAPQSAADEEAGLEDGEESQSADEEYLQELQSIEAEYGDESQDEFQHFIEEDTDTIDGGEDSQETYHDQEEQTEEDIIQEPVEDTLEDTYGAAPLSAERHEFYNSIGKETEAVLKAINQTKGVTTSLIFDRTGHIVFSMASDAVDPSELSSIILEGLEPLHTFRSKGQDVEKELLHWVLEFQDGLLIIQPLVEGVYLLVLGSKGANFGAVKYSVEKNSASLIETLKRAPA